MMVHVPVHKFTDCEASKVERSAPSEHTHLFATFA